MADGFGSITWWGFSPALDLQENGIDEMLKKLKIKHDSGEEELNILLVGAGDIRHILTTIARSWRHSPHKLHFYVLETSLELYARDMLLLNIALEPQNRMGLQEKTELFLEVYSNTFIRQQTCENIQSLSTEFIKMVTDFDYLEKKLPVFDLSQLKFKERDFLEGIFKFWRNPDKAVFDVEKCWDLRERKRLGVRYDSKKNVYDWDYHMKLIDTGADIIHKVEYNNWRESGIAFTIRDGTYDIPNKTLASGMVFTQEGEKHARRGYWGDMVVGPFLTFGIESEEKSFFKKNNDQYTKTCENVCEYNVMSLLYELINKDRYILPKPETQPESAKLTEITEEEEEAEEEVTSSVTNGNQEADNQHKEMIPVDNVKITFLPINSIDDVKKKSKYQKLFHMLYFSNSMVHHLKPDITSVLKDDASLILESAKFMIELKPEQIEEYGSKITEMAETAGFKVKKPFDGKKENFLSAVYHRT
ncbi:hypothetical protein LOTGIDRAFT_227827 [Lottia gigantea]|uniref:Dynein assembly factor 3, axonemal n=1 Tax=Lottia gigantea TaxID=225164 RepID=V4BGU5_LOTGI|nr:hypothetical protein LOTGIDRAFT_227827 [Lottia gigantea]ESP05132.1 hypothetical protein LOTGIDRAFT_227827 [Lottia gigantea]